MIVGYYKDIDRDFWNFAEKSENMGGLSLTPPELNPQEAKTINNVMI